MSLERRTILWSEGAAVVVCPPPARVREGSSTRRDRQVVTGQGGCPHIPRGRHSTAAVGGTLAINTPCSDRSVRLTVSQSINATLAASDVQLHLLPLGTASPRSIGKEKKISLFPMKTR
ncbi:hypothetical protein E2C01_025996 [Portunus trituberculatus]|uniref:Uncharacterized protein n=1 Tax=Portunus trituberculatus TaxID=210409 RepID=A0A5B7EEM5_PORTR|nr:hypothetical protein [Portunus trituberculatus]